VIGEKLSKLIERAGGFRPTAFPQGAVLERVHVRELEEKSQKELIDRIQSQGVGGVVSQLPGANAQDTAAQLQAMEEQQKQAVAALRSHPPSGRLVINISANINEWKDKSGDLEIRTGDVITIPKRSDLVMINGQIYNPSAMSFVPGKSAEWYLRAAGGFTELANKHAVFIVRANGSVISNGGGHNGHNVLTTRVKTGDMIIVPQKVVGGSPTWRNLINAAQVISGMAITARVATSF
jgi:protein involved in polysaccharide export with SLBB domain